MRAIALLLAMATGPALACGELVTLQTHDGTARSQVVVVSGGTPGAGDGCEGRTPHGFNGMEAEVVAGIARFVRGGRY